MAAAVGATAAAALVRRKIEAMNVSGPVVELSPEQFQSIISTAPDVYVLRHERKTIWREHHQSWRYLTSAKGIVFYCDTNPEITVPATIPVIDCGDIVVPQDL